jgi:site-specific DNA-cytosine methylase
MHKGFLNKTGDFGKKFKPQIDKINPKAACLTGNMHKIQVTGDYICVSMCGRNIVDGKRKDYKGAPTEQRLEINREGKTNCLTPVGKDDLILLVPEATKKGFAEIEPGQVFDAENPNSKTRRGRKMDTKSNCLVAKTTDFIKYTEDYNLRRLTPIECERLQTVPDNYTDHVSNTQRYKMLGNGWTVDTIAHILNNFDLL